MSHQQKSHYPIAAIILSGGLGLRMDGLDKGLQIYKNKPLVSWVINAIQPQVNHIVLSINRNVDDYKQFSIPTVFDKVENDSSNGPLAGILSCVESINLKDYDYVLIASCDSPKLNDNYVSQLSNGLREANADVAVVNDGVRNQNLHCLITATSLKQLPAYYNDGGRSMYGWLKQITLTEVNFSDQADCFININSIEELTNT